MRPRTSLALLTISLAPIAFTACATTGDRATSSAVQGDAAVPGDYSGKSGQRRLPNPVSQPTLFESPVVDSNIRPVFMQHELPTSSIFGGGDVQIYALQLRYAVNERLGLIAVKDGFIDFNPNNGTDETGFADIAAGLKYALVQDPAEGVLVSVGATYEIDSGDHEVFQGRGDGVLRLFASGGYELDKFNAIGNLGYNLPMHSGDKSHSIDYHAHFDYEVTEDFAPLVELHGMSFTKSGDALAVNFEGGDLINLGAGGVAGNDVFAAAVGGRFRVGEDASIGAAYEFPIGGRDDILDWRVTIDFLYNF